MFFSLLQDDFPVFVVHLGDGICMLKTDWAEALVILETVAPYLQLVLMGAPFSNNIDKDSKTLRKYYTGVLNTAFDKLTRALWPSVSYWTLIDWSNMGGLPVNSFDFHKVRWRALLREYSNEGSFTNFLLC